MAAKSSEWRPGPTVCRCCLTEGCYKDISTEYFWMGKREVYAEMLKETLEVTISYSKTGGPNSNSRLICEPCISRLRDATEFKRQVVECERVFMQHLDPGSTSLDIEVDSEPMEKIKIEGVKLEKSHSDDEEFGDRHFGDDDDDDDDDLDNQPLTKLASRVPKKESVDLLDLLDTSKPAQKRKSTVKVKPPPSKKAKTKIEAAKAKPSSSKAKPEKKKKEQTPNPMTMARRNAQILVQFVTAYPFKLPVTCMVCVYCDQSYQDPALYRAHVDSNHDDFKPYLAFAHINEGYVKVDCTDLKCRICKLTLDKIETAAEHLLKDHDKPIDLRYDCGLQPFNFKTEQLLCVICNKNFMNLRALSRHTQSHYNKCTCEQCGKCYLSTSALRYHIRLSHAVTADQKICNKCKQIFDSVEERRAHMSVSKKCWKHSCRICYNKFMTGILRDEHLKDVHGVVKPTLECPECKKTFPDGRAVGKHFKIHHTNTYFGCPFCNRKFDSKSGLEKHRVTHTKEKRFSCDQCSRAFPRKSTLVTHMWIHSDSKRFVCHVCSKPFNQKVSWKTHMKSYHSEEM
ncbi:oocyte zinc finger protein XlCOF7.1-like isoform X15 [Plodia interpunctella]|uniref:oocyte zinc finger protein XlCOF7.1-like isoform X15 n=1 Tax=Plodia interpunctella TaxID=58824 RepID=UPI0023677449|nr:oocyte zinc finger protein XlCOF7.1-like isoform X14 [Plodia interpunctella]